MTRLEQLDGSRAAERGLVFLLRLGGVMTLLAFPTMLLPVDWIAATHRWLGLGTYPGTAIVDYLSRSIAGLYGFHGGLLIIVSTDVRRYRGIVCYLGVMNVSFGLMLLAIDLHAGLPGWWTFGEGPPVAVIGLVILALARRVPRTGSQSSRAVSPPGW